MSWSAGKIHPIIQDKLSFAAFDSHESAMACQEKNPSRFFVSGNFQHLYLPFVSDFGPVKLSVVHAFQHFMLQFRECPRELVYVSVSFATATVWLVCATFARPIAVFDLL